MKVLLVNGSPQQFGCTYTALKEIADTLAVEGVESEIMWLGKDAVNDCINCGGCAKLRKNRCVFDNDIVNRLLEKAELCDGFVFGHLFITAMPTAEFFLFWTVYFSQVTEYLSTSPAQ